MRTKALLAVAALAAGIATSMAQSNVYSLNVVGYYNITVPAGKFALLGNQLVQTNQTVDSLLSASVPDGTSVLTWNGARFVADNFTAGLGWDDPSVALTPGKGFFLKNNSTSPLNLTFVGEVNQTQVTLNFTAGVFNLVSLATPQAGLLDANFGYPAADGDAVLFWNGSLYVQDGYAAGLGWDFDPALKVGDGFFVKSANTKTWTRTFTVQ